MVFDAVRVWPSAAVPATATAPVGASLTFWMVMVEVAELWAPTLSVTAMVTFRAPAAGASDVPWNRTAWVIAFSVASSASEVRLRRLST